MRKSAYCNSFWLGRYVERAAFVGRLATSHCGSELARSNSFEILVCAIKEAFLELPPALHSSKPYPELVFRELVFGKDSSSSVSNCLRSARLNATQIRDLLSERQWSALYDAREAIDSIEGMERFSGAVATAMEVIDERLTLVTCQAGLILDGGSIGPTLKLGISIERASQVMLIVNAWRHTIDDFPSALAAGQRLALEACGAEIAYDQFRGSDGVGELGPFDFLLYSDTLNLSVVVSLRTASECLSRLGFTGDGVTPCTGVALGAHLDWLRKFLSGKPGEEGGRASLKLVNEVCAQANELFCLD